MKKMNEKGFTLAELLIVVAVIAVLVAVAIPTFSNQLEKARQAVDVSNLRGAYAAAKLAAMDGQVDNVTIQNDGIYYYDPDSGSLTAVGSGTSFANYGKAASTKVVADTSNLGFEVFYDDLHIASKDKHILVQFRVVNNATSIKQISFESANTMTAPPNYDTALYTGGIVSINGAWVPFAKVAYTANSATTAVDLSNEETAKVLITAKDASGAQNKCLATIKQLQSETSAVVTYSYGGETAKDLDSTNKTFTVTHFANDTTKSLVLQGKSPVTGSATFDIVSAKAG